MCVFAHHILLDKVERIALADRQAQMTVAIAQRWEDWTPIDVMERVSDWEAWLAHDPTDTDEARADARFRELLEVA